jgi:hypothetical protein
MQESASADHFDDASDNAEPLAEADLGNQLHHERSGGQLCCAGGKERKRDDDLQDPDTNATIANASGFN